LVSNLLFCNITVDLRMGSNKFSGSIRSTFHRLKNLEVLQLNNNRFTGTLEQDTFDHLPRLEELRLSNNLFSGTVPHSVVNLSVLSK
jgi:hypothetical protein